MAENPGNTAVLEPQAESEAFSGLRHALTHDSVVPVRRERPRNEIESRVASRTPIVSPIQSRSLLTHAIRKVELQRLYHEPSESEAKPIPDNNDETPQFRQTQKASERRAFPRRDSSCVVSVCRSDSDFDPEDLVNARLELERRAWQLHSSSLKGPLVDLRMNGVAFSLDEAMPEGRMSACSIAKPPIRSGTRCRRTSRAIHFPERRFLESAM